ncbi:hypothetical protein [Bacillus sp. es.036]|uniref:hypothetical protein n=1 Tax=Bacillus sp. es.036 TaxID=1761764 RepID=UPI000BF2A1FA|nr:hypothetical protein [Bacillus sp. es.036]PFG13492.1 hypothetical protein ATG70_1696 [Bacillus sp. es.036]
MDQLYMSLKKAGLIFKDNSEYGKVDFILLETSEDGTTNSVDVITFETLFGDVKTNPTYEALSGLHTFKIKDKEYTMTATATEMGYQKYFDQWLAQGLIN